MIVSDRVNIYTDGAVWQLGLSWSWSWSWGLDSTFALDYATDSSSTVSLRLKIMGRLVRAPHKSAVTPAQWPVVVDQCSNCNRIREISMRYIRAQWLSVTASKKKTLSGTWFCFYAGLNLPHFTSSFRTFLWYLAFRPQCSFCLQF